MRCSRNAKQNVLAASTSMIEFQTRPQSLTPLMIQSSMQIIQDLKDPILTI